MGCAPESYLSRMGKDARVLIPKLMLDLLKRDKPNLEGYVTASWFRSMWFRFLLFV
jgi:hypothetical protein